MRTERGVVHLGLARLDADSAVEAHLHALAEELATSWFGPYWSAGDVRQRVELHSHSGLPHSLGAALVVLLDGQAVARLTADAIDVMRMPPFGEGPRVLALRQEVRWR